MSTELLGLDPLDGVDPLAARMRRSSCEGLTYYRKAHGLTDCEEEQEALGQVAVTPSEIVGWDDLNAACALDARAGWNVWQRIMEDARDELRSGHRAACVIEKPNAKPIDRARFLVLRESLIEDWQPRGGIELTLIDQLAQAQSEYEAWTVKLVERTERDAAEDSRLLQNEHEKEWRGHWRRGEWVPPRVSVAEAVSEARDMVRMWHACYARVLRQLRDLRRYNSAIFVKNVNQLNAGGQQVNIAAGSRDEQT